MGWYDLSRLWEANNTRHIRSMDRRMQALMEGDFQFGAFWGCVVRE